jgi:hypothetical protein
MRADTNGGAGRTKATTPCVGNTVDGLHMYDVSDPINPLEVGSVNVGFVRSVATSGNYVFLANDTSGLRIFRQSSRQWPDPNSQKR